jgi:peptidoglycan/LPS O-acetylase OafA/YrhL
VSHGTDPTIVYSERFPGLKTSETIIYSHTALRGIAAMYVVFFHLWSDDAGSWSNKSAFCQLFQWGGFAVDLFFVLSGFILNWVYLSNAAKLDWDSFFRARAARILPLYYLTMFIVLPVGVYSIIKHGFDYVGQHYPEYCVLNLFLVSGIVDGYHDTLNTPAWSISVEMFCYLAVFPLLGLFNKCFRTRAYSLVLSCLMAVVCTCLFMVCNGWTSIPIHHWHWNGSFLFKGIFGFSVGFMVCSIYRNLVDFKPGGILVDLAVAFTIIIFLMVQFTSLPSSFMLCTLPVLVFFTVTDKGLAARVFKTKPFQWLGERSYSIYLWHSLCLIGTGFLKMHMPMPVYDVFVIVLILIVSELSYNYFERPCRRLIRDLGKVKLVAIEGGKPKLC